MNTAYKRWYTLAPIITTAAMRWTMPRTVSPMPGSSDSQESGYFRAKPVMTSVTKDASSAMCCQRWLVVMRVTVRG